MKRSVAALATGTLLLLTSGSQLPGTPPPELRDLFNGKDLTGWVNVNTDPDTWSLRDGLLVCKGKPIGVMRSENPRGERSMSIENLCEARGEWNTYQVVAVDGVIKLSVNREFVNGISRSPEKEGYLCLESESAEIHFRKIKIKELPHGVTSLEQSAPEFD